ncbi:DUF3267 domain-containing protein [Halorarius litoreus]|uniref:DUF3267 domain-containing protein n=1 Tax=Halorarius litoreus TaxID=2962676 RepID=UPI0020CBE2CA|nr:DUF3267 domain-containing protein [Halorarius litoreus]
MATVPSTDRVLTEFTPTREVVLVWTGIGTGLFLVAAFLFSGIYAWATGRSSLSFVSFQFEAFETALAFVAVVVLIAGTIVVHELIHAAVIRWYGGDVSFGVGLAQYVMPYAYATTTHRFTRDQFLAVAVAPLVGITAFGVPAMVLFDAPWLVLPLAVNASGAIGDLWMTGLLLRYPRHVVVEDHTTGLRVYGRETDVSLPPTPATAFLIRALMGTGVAFGVVLLAALAAPLVLSILGVDSLVVGIPDSPWLVLEFRATPGGGFESAFGIVGMLGVSLLFGVGAALASTLWRRDAVPAA